MPRRGATVARGSTTGPDWHTAGQVIELQPFRELRRPFDATPRSLKAPVPALQVTVPDVNAVPRIGKAALRLLQPTVLGCRAMGRFPESGLPTCPTALQRVDATLLYGCATLPTRRATAPIGQRMLPNRKAAA
ncbi:MAG: hypothetical protein ACT4P7_08045 [Gemmatimonadaceae bacterium]